MLVECVPNFSEGRNTKVVERLIDAVESVAGAFVLDRHIDPDHNRSVITFVAEPSVVVEAAVRVVARAKELIDLTKHKGEHPRIGATDVFPFVPIKGVTMDDCVALAHEAGNRIANELNIPVFFYQYAALKPERKNLETIRRGGLRGLKERIETNEMWLPDVGPPHLHETAGACVVGARKFLIAYNINLKTDNIKIANRIAKTVRASGGGLPYLKAIGIELHTRGIVQVSMNLIDFEKTSIKQAFEAVKHETEKSGIEILSSEIVGLIPQAALDETAECFQTIENFTSQTILENRIIARTVDAIDGSR
jgi:glutamate formiminotransferase